MKLTILLLLLPFSEPNQRLVEHLFDNYLPEASPEPPVKVQVTIVLKDLISVNEKDETITISEWRCYYWNDERLIWNQTLFNQYHAISVLHNKVWKPDIRLLDISRSEIVVQQLDSVKVRITSDGDVTFCQPAISTVRCLMDVSLLPFDRQNCTLHYESWSESSNQMQLELLNPWKVLDEQFSSYEWTIDDKSVQVGDSVYTESERIVKYAHVNISILFSRVPSYYMWVIVAPSVVLTNINIIGVFAPFTAGGARQEKVTLGITTLLAMTVMLQIVAESMPRTSHGLPLLGKYIVCEIGMTALVTTISVVIMLMDHRALRHQWDAPCWLLGMFCLNQKPMKNRLEEKMKKRLRRRRTEECLLNEDDSPVGKLHQAVQLFSDYLKEIIEEQERQKFWNDALDRLDLTLILVFLKLNTLVTVVVFWRVLYR